jgi:hypothetical protein
VDIVQVVVGNLVGIIIFVLIGMTVLKVTQIATTLNEIKDVLADIRRNSEDYTAPRHATPARPSYQPTGEEMLRALSDAPETPVVPQIIQPR